MTRHTILAAVLLFTPFSFTQQDASQAKGEAVLVTLTAPVFSPLARQANVEGDVVVAVTVHPDGTADAVVVSGHPLLKQSALDSATQSKFECHHCSAPVSYSLLYKFIRTAEGSCCYGMGSPVKVEQRPPVSEEGKTRTVITVSAEKICLCDPAATLTKRVRSLKCLYLWKCSVRG